MSMWKLGILLFVVTVIEAQQGAPRVDANALRNAGTAKDTLAGSWLTYGLTQGETRYSPLEQINAGNVGRLGLAWTYAAGAGGGNQEATPLVWNNTLYGITNWSVVFAVDARTGKELWRWDPEVNQAAVRPKICCGVVNRGIAIYEGMIFAPVDRRAAVGAQRADRQVGVGSARRVSAGSVHVDDGAAHREREGDHRRGGRRQSDARVLRRVRRGDGGSGVALLYGAGRSVEALRE